MSDAKKHFWYEKRDDKYVLLSQWAGDNPNAGEPWVWGQELTEAEAERVCRLMLNMPFAVYGKPDV